MARQNVSGRFILFLLAVGIALTAWYFYTRPGGATLPSGGSLPPITRHPNRPPADHQQYLQDARRTPGDVIEGITKDDVCTPGYSKKVRNVPKHLKDQVYEEYGRERQEGVCCEVDHLISLELGGSNDIKNLWPEPYEPRPGAYEKDKVEDYLHRQVCQGNISLEEAQKQIATDWYEVYQRIH